MVRGREDAPSGRRRLRGELFGRWVKQIGGHRVADVFLQLLERRGLGDDGRVDAARRVTPPSREISNWMLVFIETG